MDSLLHNTDGMIWFVGLPLVALLTYLIYLATTWAVWAIEWILAYGATVRRRFKEQQSIRRWEREQAMFRHPASVNQRKRLEGN